MSSSLASSTLSQNSTSTSTTSSASATSTCSYTSDRTSSTRPPGQGIRCALGQSGIGTPAGDWLQHCCGEPVVPYDSFYFDEKNRTAINVTSAYCPVPNQAAARKLQQCGEDGCYLYACFTPTDQNSASGITPEICFRQPTNMKQGAIWIAMILGFSIIGRGLL